MDSDSSSESDDEFLTTANAVQGNVDRESLIRKKLLESFYGKSSVDDTEEGGDRGVGNVHGSMQQKSEEGSNADTNIDRVQRRSNEKSSEDLDSPYFDAEAHTFHHIRNSSVQTLLETEERLALGVRTLDSTMQTLVYENYSRFIDATDAIRSIGVNVQANEHGLSRLSKGMQIVDEQSRVVEEDLGDLRDAVAEKIRMKRLLTRLDALLKLPKTLKEQIANGQYRKATKSFLTATSILSKHSAGFESLQKIEIECNIILDDMLKDLKLKLFCWSGHKTNVAQIEERDILQSGSTHSEDSSLNPASYTGFIQEPPKNTAEIFECAGTLAMLLRRINTKKITSGSVDKFGILHIGDIKSMSLSASLRLLERIFDTHHIEMHEFSFGVNENGIETDQNLEDALGIDSNAALKGGNLIPTKAIDGILETATLYSITFGRNENEDTQLSDSNILVDFVSEAFESFIFHVRSILLERLLQIQHASGEDENLTQDRAHEEVSGSMSILLHCVRELASGLTFSEVGISDAFASHLIEQTEDLTKAIVRRRIDHKFCDLRLIIVEDCLVPFILGAFADSGEEERTGDSKVLQIVENAGVALSDCLQLIDDIVRSTIADSNAVGASSLRVDLAVLKEAIELSTSRLALWLAGILEVLAGCESSDSNIALEARRNVLDDSGSDKLESMETTHVQGAALQNDDISEITNENDPLTTKVDYAIRELLSELDTNGSSVGFSDLTLAICEMCRIGERTVAEKMKQSIALHYGGEKKRSSELFVSNEYNRGRGSLPLSDKEKKTSERFRLAASRILTLYATNRGSEAASILCAGFAHLSEKRNKFPVAPRMETWHVLEIVKLTSYDCAEIFGGSKRAAPILELDVNKPVVVQSGRLKSKSTGLQLDVERMFQEKVSIYPHPSQFVDFTRNAVVTSVFKVTFKALFEQMRQYCFSTVAYQQLQVDIEFFQHMIPHYVKDDFLAEGANSCSLLSNMLTDTLNGAGERCLDIEFVTNENNIITARSIVSDFMRSNCSDDGEDIISRFVISEE